MRTEAQGPRGQWLEREIKNTHLFSQVSISLANPSMEVCTKASGLIVRRKLMSFLTTLLKNIIKSQFHLFHRERFSMIIWKVRIFLISTTYLLVSSPIAFFVVVVVVIGFLNFVMKRKLYSDCRRVTCSLTNWKTPEQFSIACRNTKTRVITKANQVKGFLYIQPETGNLLKSGKTRVSKSRMGLIFVWLMAQNEIKAEPNLSRIISKLDW